MPTNCPCAYFVDFPGMKIRNDIETLKDVFSEILAMPCNDGVTITQFRNRGTKRGLIFFLSTKVFPRNYIHSPIPLGGFDTPMKFVV